MARNESNESGFIGRQQELALLTAALNETLAGQRQVVMVAGEPGIGKTSISRELAAFAAQKDVEVLWGSCYDGDGAPPYWPWSQAIGSYVERLSTEQLSTSLESGNTSIAEIVPQIVQKLPDLVKPPTLEPEQARFQLFDSVATFLSKASNSGPLLIVLEDLHWADHASLMLLEFVVTAAPGGRLMFLGTYRDVELGRRHPLSRTLGELVREANFQRVHLRSFNQDEVGQFVESRVSISLKHADLELVHGRTGGNPLFLNELMRLQAEEGTADTEAWKTGLPEGIRDVIGRRLDRLSERCNEALTTASVIGPEFRFDQLQPLLEGVTGVELLEFVEEAASARVIEEIPGSSGMYRFSHALIQETLNQELSMTGRVRLHVRIAESLEGIYGDDSETHAAELAHHFSQGAMLAGTGKMVHYSGLAGDQALAVHAPEEALAHFQRALAVKEERAMDAETAALLFGLGRAQAATLERHQISEAAVSLGRAFDYFVESKDLDRALMVVEAPIHGVVGAHTTMRQLLERALKLAPPESHQAGRLLSAYGQELGNVAGDYAAAQSAFSQALAIARREGDDGLEMRTLLAAARVDFSHAKWRAAAENSMKTIPLASRANDVSSELDAHRIASLSLRNTGNPRDAHFHAAAAMSMAERLRNRAWLALVSAANATLYQLAGDWSTSREYTDRGLEESFQNPTLLVSRSLLEYEVGNFDLGDELLDRMMEVMGRADAEPSALFAYPGIVLPLAARITGGPKQFNVAASAAHTVLSSESASPIFTIICRSSLGLMAIEEGDSDTIIEQYNALVPENGTILTAALTSMDRILGQLSAATGNWDQAANHFEDALTFCRTAGYRPELAWTCHDYAEALLARNGEGDGLKASSLREQALAIASDLGMRPLMERATQRLAEAQPGLTSAYPDGLTPREVEVLRLISAGMTDREIADALFISSRTVGNHVTSILNKTSASNRTGATSYAHVHGLVTQDSGPEG